MGGGLEELGTMRGGASFGYSNLGQAGGTRFGKEILDLLLVLRDKLEFEEEEEEAESLDREGGVARGLGSGVAIGIGIPAPLHSRMRIFC